MGRGGGGGDGVGAGVEEARWHFMLPTGGEMTGNGEVKSDFSHAAGTKKDGGGRKREGQEGENKLTKNKRGSGGDVSAENVCRRFSWEGLLGVDVKKPRAFLRCN